MSEQAPSKEKMQEQLTSLLYALHVQLDVNQHIPESVKTDRGQFYIRNWLTVIRDDLTKFEEAFRASPEPPAVPARVRLLKDIYDDGQDCHPPGYIARKGEIVEVREVRALAVAHEGITDQSFVVRAGEFEPASSQPPRNVQGAIFDRLGWICSVCHGWNHQQDVHCTHTHSGSVSTKGADHG